MGTEAHVEIAYRIPLNASRVTLQKLRAAIRRPSDKLISFCDDYCGGVSSACGWRFCVFYVSYRRALVATLLRNFNIDHRVLEFT